MSTDSAHALRIEVAQLTKERDEARDRVSQLSSVVLDRGQQIAAERERFSAALAAANARADEWQALAKTNAASLAVITESLAAARRGTTEALGRAALEVRAAFEDGGNWDGLQARIRNGKWTVAAPTTEKPDWSVRAGDKCTRVACDRKVVAACLPHEFGGCDEHMREHDRRCAYALAAPAPAPGEET